MGNFVFVQKIFSYYFTNLKIFYWSVIVYEAEKPPEQSALIRVQFQNKLVFYCITHSAHSTSRELSLFASWNMIDLSQSLSILAITAVWTLYLLSTDFRRTR